MQPRRIGMVGMVEEKGCRIWFCRSEEHGEDHCFTISFFPSLFFFKISVVDVKV
jgi:hypothetical protein